MKQTKVLIVGASISGLASAACLEKQGIDYTIIEKHSQLATPWRNHYLRLSLHTNKRVSNLPYKKFSSEVPRYPKRQQVVDYLENYANEFGIQPLFKTEATSIKKSGEHWITETNAESFQSKYVIMATGAFARPKKIPFKGIESFTGEIIHSAEYRTGADFHGLKVLVVGFGNSACEIAIDLFEQGAVPFMSVRSPVNIIPRDVLGIPILEISQWMSKLPPGIADTINAPLLKLLIGDITKLGLKKMPYGPFKQIQKDASIPVLDIGTVKHIRKGHIKIFGEISHIGGSTVYFTDGKEQDVNVIIAGIGYDTNFTEILKVESSRFEELKFPLRQQKYFGKEGLYFCGFYISPTGQIKEISKDAIEIVKDIAKQESKY